MKKILLASTMLAASAGFAAADVAVSGSARMGVIYDGSDALFSSRVRINFSGSGTTDGGLAFGASMRADQTGGNGAKTVVTSVTTVKTNGLDGLPNTLDDGVSTTTTTSTIGNSGTTNGDSTVFVSGAFGKLTMGDTGNAPDNLVGQVSGVGYGPGTLDGFADLAFVGSNTATGVSYNYSAGSLTFELGSGQVGSDYLSAAASYTTGAYTVALGYEIDSSGIGDVTGLSAKGTAAFGAATVKLKLADNSANDAMGYAVSVDYAIGAATVTAFYADANVLPNDDAHIGLGVAYDLGGGATIKAGVGNDGNDTFADAGITMAF